MDRVAISVAGPRIQDSLHISPERWGWVVGIFAVSYAIFEIPTGRLGDRIGARRVLTRVVLRWSVVWAGSCFPCPLATSSYGSAATISR
jgi:MFS transporter, ACS family, glucarate transporter